MRLLPVIALFTACSTAAAQGGWHSRLRANAIVLLGEVHDNAEHHRMRLQALRDAIAAGWRPAIAMEQFDRERQADIDRARSERPRDVQHLIASATPRDARWQWEHYRPVVALALEHGLPLIAANLSSADAGRIVRGGYAAVFDANTLEALTLNRPIEPEWQAAQEREIDAGHCGLLPRNAWPAMARAQFARDAVMASVLQAHAARGVVLVAGNGHVRRDIGVPRWLSEDERMRVVAVGYLEGSEMAPPKAFDAVEHAAAPARTDPCAGLSKRLPGS
jgi:uncharacterized iron-regulated protein